MSITFAHRDGGMDDGSEAGIPSLVAELDGPIDDEHPDVSVTDDESSWIVSAFQGGTVVLENLDDSDVEPRHLPHASRMEAVQVMAMLARGDLAALQQLDWRPGYE
ncbi:hypothetical protein [Streptomyces odonnellii]|uniref:hypothetical protein n=1 Tax=Streptomyces odonnellii TaxID=1417980 RepID=UPI0012FEEB0F|nr:hypothetical protein [Streptomyces odonnellii]